MSLTHWILEGRKPVNPAVADVRAMICAECPQNENEALYESAIGTAARVLKAALRRKHQMALRTASDGALHVCGACGCALGLKVHAPVEVIFKDGRKPPYFDKLDGRCWIRMEARR